MSSKAAKRYAQAFLGTAIEKNILEEIKKDIDMIGEVLNSSKELRLFLKSPLVKQEQKRSVLEEIFGSQIHTLTAKLLELLTEKNRVVLLEQITKHFQDLYNIHHGIVEIQVTSAFELNEKQKTGLISQLESATGKTVQLNQTVNSELIGGIMVRIDDTVIDGSVKFKLNQLKDKFSSAAVE